VLDALTGQWWPIIKAGQRQDGVSASFGHPDTAESLEPGRIGLGHRERIGDACRQLPEHAVAERRRERRLEGPHRLGIEHAQWHPQLGRDGPLARGAGKALIAAVELENSGRIACMVSTRRSGEE
jgi:hypothetical protein